MPRALAKEQRVFGLTVRVNIRAMRINQRCVAPHRKPREPFHLRLDEHVLHNQSQNLHHHQSQNFRPYQSPNVFFWCIPTLLARFYQAPCGALGALENLTGEEIARLEPGCWLVDQVCAWCVASDCMHARVCVCVGVCGHGWDDSPTGGWRKCLWPNERRSTCPPPQVITFYMYLLSKREAER